jgi:hypothetical protein
MKANKLSEVAQKFLYEGLGPGTKIEDYKGCDVEEMIELCKQGLQGRETKKYLNPITGQMDFVTDYISEETISDWRLALTEIIALANELSYQVIEDNGGGLSLWVWNNDKLIFGHVGYEYLSTNADTGLVPDLNALDAGDNTSSWEGNDATQEDHDSLTDSEYGWKLIAEGGTGKDRTLYPDQMGRAAEIAFGIESD